MKLKKILAAAMAGVMVMASAVPAMATPASSFTESLEGNVWWNYDNRGVGVAFKEGSSIAIEFTCTDSINEGLAALEFRDSGHGSIVDIALYDGTSWGEDFVDSYTTDSGVTGVENWIRSTTGNSYTAVVSYVDSTTITCVVTDDTAGTTMYTTTVKLKAALPEDEVVFFYPNFGKYDVTYTEVGIYSDDISILLDDTKSINLVKKPVSLSGTVTYVSSNEEVATVNENGVVTGVAVGTATITATCGEYTTTSTVTVTDEVKPITKVTATADKTELTVGGTATISTSYEPEDTTDDTTVTYASSDDKVVKVDEKGVVTAVAAGKATVTAEIAGVKADPIEFTVSEAPVADDNNTDDIDDSDNVEEEVYELDCPSWWSTFSDGFEITDELTTYKFTNTTYADAADVYCGPVYVLYTGSENKVNGEGYSELLVSRADGNAWFFDGVAALGNTVGNLTVDKTGVVGDATGDLPEGYTFTVTASPDWADYLAALKAGCEVTVTTQLVDGKAVITSSCAGMDYTVEVPVGDAEVLYLSFSGEATTLTNLTINDVPSSWGGLLDTTDGADDADGVDGTADGTPGNTNEPSSPKTADAAPVIPVAAALLGCAVVAFAAKKKLV